MNRSKNTDFADRLGAAADAKKAQLERAAQARSAAESPVARCSSAIISSDLAGVMRLARDPPRAVALAMECKLILSSGEPQGCLLLKAASFRQAQSISIGTAR